MGSNWQMPSSEQFEELLNSAYTTQTWTTQNGVQGTKITGKNGNTIFLPQAGIFKGTALVNTYQGAYRTSTVSNVDDGYPYYVVSGETAFFCIEAYAWYGFTIRPVCP